MLRFFESDSQRSLGLGSLGLRGCFGLVALMAAQPASAADDPYAVFGVASPLTAHAPEDQTPRMSPAELRQTFPDLMMRDAPPTSLFSLQVGMHIPYQVLGVGAGVDLYPTRKLRIGALYSFGFSPIDNDVTTSHYAEAALGVAVIDVSTDTALDLTTRAIPYADPVTLAALVPSYRALFVEGGALTGFFSAARCTANCGADGEHKTLAADNRQFVLPFLGLRYVSYYGVSSEHAGFRKRSYLQVFAHALVRPFNTPSHAIYDYKGELLQRGNLGGRVGFDLAPPLCLAGVLLNTGCAQGGMAVGYNPTPGFVFLEFHLSYLID